MSQIGAFTRTDSGFHGHITTITFSAELVLSEVDPADNDTLPNYTIHLGEDGPVIGAAWKRFGKKAGDFLHLLIDDPVLAQPIRASLFQFDHDKNHWTLLWRRPEKRNEQA